MSTLSLFEEPVPELRSKLQRVLSALAADQLYLGTSSWKYEGWLGRIYTESRYQTRGRFSKKKFEADCLTEYAEVFPAVCGDFSYYQFPREEFWHKLFAGVPSHLKFALKVPEEVTVKVFPMHDRYGARAGFMNPNFLNADLLRAAFLELLEPFRDRIAVLIFEFSQFAKNAFPGVNEFLTELAPLLDTLPPTFRYSVEIRNREYLEPGYFQVLRDHNVAHVFNAWTRMPTVSAQMQIPDVFTADFTVTRALLKMGQKYETAVQNFSPYEAIKEPNEEVRDAMRRLLRRAKERHEPTYIFVNNRLEGFAPGTIEAVVDSL
jgi:uncharacterized protein YecE (DUF72 family)